MCDLDGCGIDPNLPPIEIDDEQRRLFLKGLAALPLAAVLATPELANAAAKTCENVSLKLADGSSVTASLALPKQIDNAPTVLLIHEWWGLNDQIKSVAAELANLGYIALAVDLYEADPVTDRESAMKMMQAVDKAKATETLTGWVDYLRKYPGSNGKVATMGWCFGGGWSLRSSIATPIDATIIYYGYVTEGSDDLAKLKGPVLGHFGTLDKRINAKMVGGFEEQMKTAGKSETLTVHWYDADHAFANPTGSRYDAEDAATAWKRTLAFLKENIG